jgi:hypothetical protein
MSNSAEESPSFFSEDHKIWNYRFVAESIGCASVSLLGFDFSGNPTYPAIYESAPPCQQVFDGLFRRLTAHKDTPLP